MTKKKVHVADLLFAVFGAVAIGIGLGLGVGFAARHFGWPTGFVGPLTGGVVSALVAGIYAGRTKAKRDTTTE